MGHIWALWSRGGVLPENRRVGSQCPWTLLLGHAFKLHGGVCYRRRIVSAKVEAALKLHKLPERRSGRLKSA